jgi:endoglucanase
VAHQIAAFCREIGLAPLADRFGNLIVWYRGAPEGIQTVPLALAAHMDHPGLEVTQAAPLMGKLLGGLRSTTGYFGRPVAVRLFDGEGEVAGRILGLEETAGEGVVRLEAARSVAAGAFGMYDVGEFREAGGLLHQPAADDLGGCAAILRTLARLVEERVSANVAGVFTRAEEVGLVGATLVARERLLPPETVVISLEASRALPGAEIGGGPVIRVGDRAMAFHPQGEALLRRAAATLAERTPAVPVQRQLMSGGTCEATAFALHGYMSTGIAFPLGNYHNAGPDFTIAAEYIHRDDLLGGVELLCAAARVAAEGNAPDPMAQRLAEIAVEAAPVLERTAGRF